MLTFKIKDMFFDRQVVIRAVDKAKRRTLSRAGAFIRQSARTSIRPRKGTSRAGNPPYSHEGSLRRFILFGYDPQTESVVVGPVGFRNSVAPHVLEFGGVTNAPRSWKRKGNSARIRIKRRPFMGPALERERDKLPWLWESSVRA
jgi:phage gpG-like protein